MSPDDFFSMIEPTAKQVCGQYELPWQVCCAQAAIESGWGKYTIGQYNFFGRKATSDDVVNGKAINEPTSEWNGSEYVSEDDYFKLYDSLEEAIDDWCILMSQDSQYANAFQIWENTQDITQFVEAMAPVYATGPNYAQEILTTISANNLN